MKLKCLSEMYIIIIRDFKNYVCRELMRMENVKIFKYMVFLNVMY